MIRFVSIFFIQFLIVLGLQAQTLSRIDVIKNQFEEKLDSLVISNKMMGVSAGVMINGELFWSSAAGFADKKNGVIYSISTKSRTASIAKPMTAIALMQLVEQGKVHLDSSIQTYLPDFPKKSKNAMTVRQVLHHTSGIKGYANDAETNNTKQYPTLEDALSIFKDRVLAFEPGTDYLYSSYGYVVLGRILEEVYKKSYEEIMKQQVFNTAQMVSTKVEDVQNLDQNTTKLYHRKSDGQIDEMNQTNLSDRVPGGGLLSTTTDILRFGNAVLTHQFIQDLTLKHMLIDPRNAKNGYGLGWGLEGELPNLGFVFGHSGGQLGAASHLFIIPEKKAVIAVMSNTSGASADVSQFARDLFELVKIVSQE